MWIVRPGALVIALAPACGCHGIVDRGVPSDGGRIHPEPKIGFSVVRSTELGPLKESPAILGRDGGITGSFDGQVVWLYGDTLFDTAHGLAMMSNSWAWTTDVDATNGVDLSFPESGSMPAPLLVESEAERRFNAAHVSASCRQEPCGARWALWPNGFVADPARHRALIFYAKVYAEVGLLRFWSTGESIAVWNGFGEAPDRRLNPATGEPPFLFAEGELAFGNARVLESDVVYAYGCEMSGWSKKCKVARVPIGDALDPHAWRYYGGRVGWTPDVSLSIPVIEANDIMSVAYNRYLGTYLAVYVPPLTNQVMMRSAPRPEGPWSSAVTAFSTATPAALWVYDAQAHPEYERDGGRIQYVTYTLAKGPRIRKSTDQRRSVRGLMT